MNTARTVMPDNPSPSYPLADLCVLVDLPPRTVRYYVQIGLVDRPQGETRAARYGSKHLERNRSLSGVLLQPPSARNNPSHIHQGGAGSDQGDSDQQQVAAA